MFQVGDKVKLNGCPYDEQIPEEMLIYTFLVTQTLTVTEVCVPDDLDGTSGQWVATDMTPRWIDAQWFKKAE